MNYKVHKLGGIMFGIAAADVMATTYVGHMAPYAIVAIPFVSAFASSLPDLDKANTHASNRMPHLSKLFQLLGHRKLSHSALIPLSLLVLGIFLSFSLSFNPIISACVLSLFVALSVGYFCHIMYDIITTMGVPLFSPIKNDSYSVGFLKNKEDGPKIAIFTAILMLPLALTLLRYLISIF